MTERVPGEPHWAPRLLALLSDAGVASVELDVFTKVESFHGPEVSAAATAIASAAREEHLRRGFGFWEFALERAITADGATRTGLLKGALRHNTGGGIRLSLTLDEFASHANNGDFDALPARTIISLCSRVARSDGDSAHLVMLDFGVPSTPDGYAAANNAVAVLGRSGALFESGRSFHFYGHSLVADDELAPVLAQAQLLSPIVDQRWISHQLFDGECRLRISYDAERNRLPIRFLRDL